MSEEFEKTTLKQILELLECPICLEISSNNFQCENGHFGCIYCYSRLFKCPQCREDIKYVIIPISKETVSSMLTELRHVEDVGNSINLKKLIEYFKCTSFNFIPTMFPVQQCWRGHWKCKDCFNKIWKQHCELCIKNYGSYHLAEYRNIFAQKVLSLVLKPCRFTLNGCSAMMRELSKHEQEECFYRDVWCIFPGCESKHPMNKLLNHLEKFSPDHSCLIPPLASHLGDNPSETKGFIDSADFLSLVCPQNPSKMLTKIVFLKLDINAFFFQCFGYSFLDVFSFGFII